MAGHVILPIADIKVAKRRQRELGDIDTLAESVKERGLLQDLVIDKKNNLLAGYRRLVALNNLGRTHASCKICDTADDALKALLVERDENLCRKPLNPSEAVSLGLMIEELEKPLAKARMGHKGVEDAGSAEGKAAAAVGMSLSTYKDAKAVVESQNGKLIEEMDTTGTVHSAVKKLKKKAVDSFPKSLVKSFRKAVNGKKIVATPEQLEAFAKFDADDQKELLQSVLQGKQTLAQAIETGEVPGQTVEAAMTECNGAIESFCRQLMKFVEDNVPDGDPWLDHMGRKESALQKFKDGCDTLRTCKCSHVCILCNGGGCKECKKTGRLPKYVHDQLV